jgi:hypothetical protein
VTVTADGRRQTQEVAAGGSYYSQHDFALYFGLGQATRVETIEVRWPDGRTQVFKGSAANRTTTHRE